MSEYRKTIYDIFRTKSIERKNALNNIVKGTKSVLTSQNGYKLYIKNYFLSTKLSTFKCPEITEYPLLKKGSGYLIPITTHKFKEDTERKLQMKDNLFLDMELIQKNKISFLEDFNKKLNRIVRYNEEVKNSKSISKRALTENKERYNSLFLDFFHKWKSNYNRLNLKYVFSQDKANEGKNNKGILFSNFEMKERYSGLHYDEKEIFETNYNNFIISKINLAKLNKIKNFTSEIKSSFHDSNDKKIKLKLESIKLTFNPKIKDKNYYKEFCIFLPLSYVFFFYYNDFSFFQKILLSLLKFDKNYKSINFKEDGFMDILKTVHIGSTEENKEPEEDGLANFKNRESEKIRRNSPLRKTYYKNYSTNYGNKLFRRSSKLYDDDVLKTKIIHSNKKLNNVSHNKKDENKNVLYNEYFFIWETSAITYEVKLEMPKIIFSYQNFNYNISAFCEKNLFLYMFKNNFINWDFFALNYLLSFKNFRKIILHFFSLNKTENFLENNNYITNIKTVKTPNIKNKIRLNIEEENKVDNEFNFDNDDIINISNKKELNQISENNESYMFFYTDQNYNNYIVNLFSYRIKIELRKLNPKINWEFYLNFKQMRYFNEVSKYEDLLTFLPKILITNYEIGDLDINFNIFNNNFNAKILQNEDGHNSNKKKQLKIEVIKPHIESELIGGKEEKKLEKELNFNILQSINELKMENWSRKILAIMKNDLLYKSQRSSELHLNKYNFLKKSPNKEDIITNIINNKSNKKKLTFYGRIQKINIDN